ncbi:Vacuolar protein 8 [Marasmius sp. AFHP31]|nr:Vacuolar protein 8 [Marasmius sp. AFHP31]
MLIPNVKVQCNAVGCVTNLATHDDNKTKIPKSGALVPLTRLARLKDMRVQRNATGALLNMTHSGTPKECRQQLVNTGAILVLVSLLDSHETDVQYYFTTALSNVAIDERTQVGDQSICIDGEHLESTNLKAQRQAALALRNLASDEKYQLEIVRAEGLSSLLRLLQSAYLPLILSSAVCVGNVSIHPQNESPRIESGFLQLLINLLSFKDGEELREEQDKAGAVASIKDLVLEVPMNVESEMTACVNVLALSDGLKGQLLEMGICEVLIPLSNSPSSEVQGNSAAALGNLCSKDGRSATVDYSAFNDVWRKPDVHRYLYRFLSSSDATFRHIAVWTIVQLLESDDPRISNIRSSTLLVPNIRNLASSQASSPSSSVGSRSQLYDDTETNDGQGEIQLLARRILEFVDGDGGWHGSLQRDTFPHTARVVDIKFEGCERTRGTVREAFAPGSHR